MSARPWDKEPGSTHEAARLEELSDYRILDTPPEPAFDRLTRMAAQRFSMPIALISLVDDKRQWFKSRYGIDAKETPRNIAFCAHAIQQEGVFVVHDTTKDPRFSQNPLVTSPPDIRFYAGAPLTTRQGYNLGTLCVIDRVPHPEFSEEEQKELAELAAIAVDEMELRVSLDTMKEDLKALQAAEAALKAERMKSESIMQDKAEFIANISHELRTPLNGILGMAYLMQDTPLDKQQREYLDTINHTAKNLLLIVNDVLDLSKIEAGELIIEKTAADIKTNFIQTIKMLQPLAQKRGTTLNFTVTPHIPPQVVCDLGRFSQIITNLVGNAVKFTENGQIDASLHYQPEKNCIYCEVQDTGIGIPEHRQNSIFEKFIQGDVAITHKYGGTGLGLAITKQLVTMQKGEIGFESQENVGSLFWFTLPITLPSDAPLPAPGTQSPNHADRLVPTANARLLVAEDHPVNRLFILALLQKMGFSHIDVAENGIEVMALMEKAGDQSYDAIFMDCRMPQQDGYQTTRLIRAREKASGAAKHVPIIAMTADALSGDREACFQAGMDEYQSKPLQPEKLKQLLGRWFTFTEQVEFSLMPQTEPGLPPLDWQRVSMIANTHDEKVEIMNLFFDMAQDFIAVMETSKRHDEFIHWRNAAHSLKGSAGNMGMTTLEKLCDQAEKAASLTYSQRTTLLQHISDELKRITIHTRHHLSQNPKM